MKQYNLFFLLFLLFGGLVNAQTWQEDFRKSDANFYEIQQKWRSHFAGIDWKNASLSERKASKHYLRWEWFWGTRHLRDGSFPDAMHTWNEWKNYQARTKSNPVARTEANEWTYVGPKSIPKGNVNYAGMGRVNDIRFDPRNANTIWLATPAGGIWRSTNAGQNWTNLSDKLPTLGFSQIAIANDGAVYAATGDCDSDHNQSIGILKSTDNGATWNLLEGLKFEKSARTRIRRLYLNPNNNNTIIAATTVGIYRSTNAGQSWTKVSETSCWDLEQKPNNPNILYGTNSIGGFLKSTDGGITWTSKAVYSSETASRMEIAVSAADPEFIFGLANLGSKKGSGGKSADGYRSNDGGETWSKLDSFPAVDLQAGFNQSLFVSQTDKNLILVAGVNGYRTKDGGTNWVNYLNGYWRTGQPFFYVHSDHHALVASPNNPNLVYSGNDGGVHRGDLSKDDAWTDLSEGLFITQYYRMGLTPQNANFILAGAQDNDVTHFEGSNINNRNNSSDGTECIWDYSDSKVAYTGSQEGGLRRTLDGWATAEEFVEIVAEKESAGFVWPIVMNPINPKSLYAGLTHIYKTTNRGNTWTSISKGKVDNSGNTWEAIAIAPSDTSRIYASDGVTLSLTKNDGSTWEKKSFDLLVGKDAQIKSIAVNPTNPEEIYVTLSGYDAGFKVLRSRNAGTTWENISGTLPNIPVHHILLQTGGNDEMYVGTDLGVFMRDKNTTDWKALDQGLPNVIVNELEIHYGTRKLRAATYGRGIWEMSLDGSTPQPNPAPVADFTANPTSGQAPLTVQFTDASKNTTANSTYAWNFGNGQTSTQKNPSTTYQNAGDYTITLTVTANGQTNTKTSSSFIRVSSAPVVPDPIADFTATPTSGEAPLRVTFNNTSQNAAGFAWDFGDGGTSTERNPTYSYQKAGNFNVKLVATGNGKTNERSRNGYISVSEPLANEDDFVQKDKFEVYPNPTKGVFEIKLESSTFRKYDLLIYNLVGGVIRQEKQISNGTYKFDLSNYSKGVYFVSINDGQTIRTEKIVVNE